MNKYLYRLTALMLACCLLYAAVPVSAEESAGPTGPAYDFSSCPVNGEPAFTWKRQQLTVSSMTTDLEAYGLGGFGGKMLLVRLESAQAANPILYDGFDQRLFALVNASGRASMCRCFVIADKDPNRLADLPAEYQRHIDLLFDLEDLGGPDPAETRLAVYEERNGEPLCLVSLEQVPAGPDTAGAREMAPYAFGCVLMKFGADYAKEDDAGEEPREWIVLDLKQDEALVISRYPVADISFGDAGSVWEDSGPRSWLNIRFLRNVFTAGERSAILQTRTDSHAILRDAGDEPQGTVTEDRLFLLSDSEAGEYFADDFHRVCISRKMRGTVTDPSFEMPALAHTRYCTRWWLRTGNPAEEKTFLASWDGSVGEMHTDNDAAGVRPAMRLNLKADPFTWDFYSEPPENGWRRQEEAVSSEKEMPSLYDRLTDLQPGDLVTFGTYDQNGSSGDGREPIAWIALEVSEGQALLASRAGLFKRVYDQTNQTSLWEKCSIRTELNGRFLQEAFTDRERVLILTGDTDNSAEQDPDRPGKTGKNTRDRVFLLSCAEAERYFPDRTSRRCAGAESYFGGEQPEFCYFTADEHPAEKWWLRGIKENKKSGESPKHPLVMGTGGMRDCPAGDAAWIRPVIRVNLDPEVAAAGTDRKVAFEENKYILYTGKPLKLSPAVIRHSDDAPAKTELVWTSSDESVATVNKGTVKGLTNGTVTVTARAKDNEAVAGTVVIEVRVPLKKLTLDAKKLTLVCGGEPEQAAAKLGFTLVPEDAFHRTVTWSSSDETVAAVDAEGNVTAVGPGKAVITAVSDDPAAPKATCSVTVKAP